MPTKSAELFHRLSDVLGAHDVHPDDRAEIQQAYVAAGSESATWDDLPPHIRGKVETIEQTYQRTAWNDPADVPADMDEVDRD